MSLGRRRPIAAEIGNNARWAFRRHRSVSIVSILNVRCGDQVIFRGATALAAMPLLTSCAVATDFLHPAAPEIRAKREPLAAATAGANVPMGQRQVLLADRDVPDEWWTLFSRRRSTL